MRRCILLPPLPSLRPTAMFERCHDRPVSPGQTDLFVQLPSVCKHRDMCAGRDGWSCNAHGHIPPDTAAGLRETQSKAMISVGNEIFVV